MTPPPGVVVCVVVAAWVAEVGGDVVVVVDFADDAGGLDGRVEVDDVVAGPDALWCLARVPRWLEADPRC